MRVLVIFGMFAASLYAETTGARTLAGGKPKVYDYVGPGSESMGDSEIKAAYGRKYAIVDLRDKKGYVPAKPSTRVSPRSLIENGQVVEGSVRVAFIVDADGQVIEPFVLHSTNRKLNGSVLHVIRQWRGAPARLNGVAIAMVYSQDFTFTRRRGGLFLRGW